MRKISTLLLSLGIALSITIPVSANSASVLESVNLGVSNAVKAAQAAITWKECSSLFTRYNQEYPNTCGAACVRMVLKVINGSAPAESTVFNGIKDKDHPSTANANNMCAYINNRISSFAYKKYLPESLSTFKTKVYNTIVNKHAPVIVLVQQNLTSTNSGWPTDSIYSHFVVIKAISSDKTKVKIADPAYGKYYEMSIQSVFNSMHDDYEYRYKSGKWISYCYLAARDW